MILAAIISATLLHGSRPNCETLRTNIVVYNVSRIESIILYNPPVASKYLSELQVYWRTTCRNDRYKANKKVVRSLSKLLTQREAIIPVSTMLIDIGKNLSAASADVDYAIFLEEALGDNSSTPIMSPIGLRLLYSLKCIRHKIRSGKIDDKYCQYLSNYGEITVTVHSMPIPISNNRQSRGIFLSGGMRFPTAKSIG